MIKEKRADTTVYLSSLIQKELEKLEAADELVILSSNTKRVADLLSRTLVTVLPSEELQPEELIGIRSLIHHAINNKAFFDWEMPTLTGNTVEEFREIANKLPKG